MKTVMGKVGIGLVLTALVVPALALAMGGSQNSLVDRAIATGRLNTLISALTAAEMVEMLRREGPYTVFAPTDQAFGRLTTGRLQYLLKPENREELRTLLRNHIVKGKLDTAAISNLRRVTTLDGKTIPIQLEGTAVRFGGASILQTGIEADNGAIFLIDQVMTP